MTIAIALEKEDKVEAAALRAAAMATGRTARNVADAGKEASLSVLRSRYRSAPARILLAEDNPLLKELTAKLLVRMGFHVTAVDDGAQAVEEVH